MLLFPVGAADTPMAETRREHTLNAIARTMFEYMGFCNNKRLEQGNIIQEEC